MIKALLRTPHCICWNVCSIICQLWNFKVRIWRYWRWSRYMTLLYFSLSESLTVLLAREDTDVVIPFVPDTFLGTDRQQLEACWGQLAVTRVTALDIRAHVRACCWGGNQPAQTLCHRDISASYQGAFFPHDHLSPDTPWNWCFHQLLFKTQINMQRIQENKTWYLCLRSLKAAGL